MNPKSSSYTSMSLSNAQKGAIGQFEFLATSLTTGNGQVEVYTPAADNEGRDAEVRRHLRRTPGIGIQVKVAFGMHKVDRRGRRTYMSVRFSIPANRLSNDPRLWYFLGVYDPHQLRLYDTCFLVPCAVLLRLSRYGTKRRGIEFVIDANVAPGSRDRWTPYRVAL